MTPISFFGKGPNDPDPQKNRKRSSILKQLGERTKDDSPNADRPTTQIRIGQTLANLQDKHTYLKTYEYLCDPNFLPFLWLLIADINGISTEMDDDGNPVAQLKRGQVIYLPTPDEIADFDPLSYGLEVEPSEQRARRDQSDAESEQDEVSEEDDDEDDDTEEEEEEVEDDDEDDDDDDDDDDDEVEDFEEEYEKEQSPADNSAPLVPPPRKQSNIPRPQENMDQGPAAADQESTLIQVPQPESEQERTQQIQADSTQSSSQPWLPDAPKTQFASDNPYAQFNTSDSSKANERKGWMRDYEKQLRPTEPVAFYKMRGNDLPLLNPSNVRWRDEYIHLDLAANVRIRTYASEIDEDFAIVLERNQGAHYSPIAAYEFHNEFIRLVKQTLAGGQQISRINLIPAVAVKLAANDLSRNWNKYLLM